MKRIWQLFCSDTNYCAVEIKSFYENLRKIFKIPPMASTSDIDIPGQEIDCLFKVWHYPYPKSRDL